MSSNVSLTALDEKGGLFSGYVGTKSLSWSGTAAASALAGQAPTFPANPVSFVNGTATVAVNLKRAGTGLTLTVGDGSVSGSATTTVTANSPSRLGFTNTTTSAGPSPSCLLGCTLVNQGGQGDVTTKVSVLDAYGNVTTTANPINVTMTRTGGTFTPAAPAISIAAGGQESANTVKLSDGGNWDSDTMTASAAGLSPNVSITISK